MRICEKNSIAIVIDVQERLFPHIYNHHELRHKIPILLKGLNLFEVPFILNEQYPKGLGKTIPEVLECLNEEEAYDKTAFSCCKNKQVLEKILKSKKNIAIIFGIETHICVLQSCLDLLANNITPVIVTDCMGSRREKDHDTAITRLIQAGAIPTTCESLLFELCKDAKHNAFKGISKLIK